MRIRDELEVSTVWKGLKGVIVHSSSQFSDHCLSDNKSSYCKTLGHCLTFTLAHWLRRIFLLETYYSVRRRSSEYMAAWFTLFLHERVKLVLTPVAQSNICYISLFTVFDPLRESLPLLFSANVDIYWKNYETGKRRIDELSNHQCSCVRNKE